jgi:hypothetical protein
MKLPYYGKSQVKLKLMETVQKHSQVQANGESAKQLWYSSGTMVKQMSQVSCKIAWLSLLYFIHYVL